MYIFQMFIPSDSKANKKNKRNKKPTKVIKKPIGYCSDTSSNSGFRLLDDDSRCDNSYVTLCLIKTFWMSCKSRDVTAI